MKWPLVLDFLGKHNKTKKRLVKIIKMSIKNFGPY